MWLRQTLGRRILQPLERVIVLFAWAWRRVLRGTTFVVVAGSVGKTTGKEMVAAVLAQQGRTYASIANQNAGLVVALNVLRVRPWHRFAVLEVSGGEVGTIGPQSKLIRPDIALMLAVRRTHTDNYATLDECAMEKAKLFEHVSEHGVGLLYGDDERVARMAAGAPVKMQRFGSSPEFELWADQVQSAWPGRLQFRAHEGGQSVQVNTQMVGRHWLPSVLAALAVGRCVGIGLEQAREGIKGVEPFRGRMQPVQLPNSAVILRDDYQSSIDVTDAALAAFGEAQARRRILVITDISDADPSRYRRRRYVAEAAARVCDTLIFIGSKADYGTRKAVEAGMDPACVFAFRTLREAADSLKNELGEGDLVLLKGRVTDHVARLFFHQFGTVNCWLEACPKTMLCDECWELGVSEEELNRVRVLKPIEAP